MIPRSTALGCFIRRFGRAAQHPNLGDTGTTGEELRDIRDFNKGKVCTTCKDSYYRWSLSDVYCHLSFHPRKRVEMQVVLWPKAWWLDRA